MFAPNSKHRARVTPARRGKGVQRAMKEELDEPTPAERRASMSWAQRLKRVFGIDRWRDFIEAVTRTETASGTPTPINRLSQQSGFLPSFAATDAAPSPT
uniref:Uncharacterized protein n=1 Tax=uncultured bacterium ws020C1 TaxID=1131823 RepID=I1X4K5_9BACT|nr:hypothetical protein ws020C1_0025 [uncultured bacterium ws020C1]